MRLKYWSVQGEEDAPKKIQKLTFTNNSKADLTFNLNINGPFEIVKTKTNSGAAHPMSGSNNSSIGATIQSETHGGEASLTKTTKSKIVKKPVETMFCLQPLKIVEVHVKFLAPQANDSKEWPMTIFNER